MGEEHPSCTPLEGRRPETQPFLHFYNRTGRQHCFVWYRCVLSIRSFSSRRRWNTNNSYVVHTAFIYSWFISYLKYFSLYKSFAQWFSDATSLLPILLIFKHSIIFACSEDGLCYPKGYYLLSIHSASKYLGVFEFPYDIFHSHWNFAYLFQWVLWCFQGFFTL